MFLLTNDRCVLFILKQIKVLEVGGVIPGEGYFLIKYLNYIERTGMLSPALYLLAHNHRPGLREAPQE